MWYIKEDEMIYTSDTFDPNHVADICERVLGDTFEGMSDFAYDGYWRIDLRPTGETVPNAVIALETAGLPVVTLAERIVTEYPEDVESAALLADRLKELQTAREDYANGTYTPQQP